MVFPSIDYSTHFVQLGGEESATATLFDFVQDQLDRKKCSNIDGMSDLSNYNNSLPNISYYLIIYFIIQISPLISIVGTLAISDMK